MFPMVGSHHNHRERVLGEIHKGCHTTNVVAGEGGMELVRWGIDNGGGGVQ